MTRLHSLQLSLSLSLFLWRSSKINTNPFFFIRSLCL